MKYTVTSTYKRNPNQDLIDEIDKKYLKVERVLNSLLLIKFYNKKALERLRNYYGFLWWREVRKNCVLDVSITANGTISNN